MKKILVTGSNGFLGMHLTEKIRVKKALKLIATGTGPDRFPDPCGYVYAPMDITEEDEVREVIGTYAPDVIIHTSAISHVDACERDPEKCRRINVEATRTLAKIAGEKGIHFIFLSTDFVFDGENGPYSESDRLSPVNEYGRSKAEAEKIVGENSTAAIVRTILVYGKPHNPARGNIVTWAVSELRAGRQIKVAGDHWRMPTYVSDLADSCISIAEQRMGGIFHISGEEGMSVYELVCRAARFYQLDETLIEAVPASFFGGQARRPMRTGFHITRAKDEIDYQPLPVDEAFRVMNL
ncbi:MAG: SDR family oxidoreductase [Mucilaginibacter polytrichastri]|nr:SDR family oxidoreductase [Mucilaginibacter polytrichastri]